MAEMDQMTENLSDQTLKPIIVRPSSKLSSSLQQQQQSWQLSSSTQSQQPPTLSSSNRSSKIPKRFIMILMGFLGYNLLYMLRVNLSVAIVAMVKHENIKNNETISNLLIDSDHSNNNNNDDDDGPEQFEWNENIQALVLSSFFVGYVLTQIPGGRLADIFGSKWLFGLGIFITSLLTLLCPLAARLHYRIFILCRIFQGIFEGLAFPSMHSMLAKWIPIYEQSRMATFLYSGTYIGTVITMPFAALLCDSKFFGGWPSVFYLSGLLGILWTIFWFYLICETPEKHPTITKDELELILSNRKQNFNQKKPKLPLKSILTSVPFYALILAHFGFNWGLYTFLTQLPRYFNNVLHFDMKKNGFYSSLPYLCQAFVGCLSGHICDKLYSKKVFTLNQLRKTFNTIASICPTICLLIIIQFGSEISKSPIWCIILITIALGINGTGLSGFQVTHIDMSPTFASTLMGITNCIANFSGILAPYVVGFILTATATTTIEDQSNNHKHNNDSMLITTPKSSSSIETNIIGWNYVFYLVCFIYMFSAIIFVIFGSNQIQPWDRPKQQQQEQEEEEESNQQ